MSSAICFDLGQSKILSSGNDLNIPIWISVLMIQQYSYQGVSVKKFKAIFKTVYMLFLFVVL